MPEVSKSARRGRQQATDKVDEAREDVQDTSQDASPDGGGQNENAGQTITGELRDTFREAAIEVLKPVMKSATKSAAKYAVTQGPELVKDRVMPKLEEAGGAGALVKGIASTGGGVGQAVGGLAGGIAGKLGGGGKDGESPKGTGRGRRLPVQEFVDVGVDLETAYDQFTQFEEWPQFMHRVERIEQEDDTTLRWHENIWGVRRSWKAEITDQTPCERIAWRSTDGPQTVGVVTFHRLSDRLTRIYITLDFQPKGLFEKTASGMRISRRALKSDLMRFKAYLEMQDEASGAWRGQIEEGEVVEGESGDEGEEPTAEEGEEEPTGEEDEEEEPAAEEDEEEEPTAEEEEEPSAEEEEEEEPEEAPQPRSRSRSRRNARFKRDTEEEQEEPAEEEPEERPARRRSSSSGRRRRTTATRGSR